MDVSMLSVSEAAERLGISSVRVRQRIEEGSLIADKVGNRWIVDLSVVPASKRRGRPVNAEVVWDAIRRVDRAEALRQEHGPGVEEALRRAYDDRRRAQGSGHTGLDLLLSDGSVIEAELSASSRRRAFLRLFAAATSAGAPNGGSELESVLSWLSARAVRHLYRAQRLDLGALSSDERVLPSGLSDPRSGLQDARVFEGYVAIGDLDGLVDDHWLDPPGVGAAPNVYLHVAQGRPTRVTSLMLAVDLSEHEGPRERARALELLQAALS